jgi:long-subunit acyl-CoA synthetase (AMP-forming)
MQNSRFHIGLSYPFRNFKTGTGKFEFLTYKQVHTKVAHVAAGLSSLGIQTKQRVGVFGINCPEYMIAMQVCFFYTMGEPLQLHSGF